MVLGQGSILSISLRDQVENLKENSSHIDVPILFLSERKRGNKRKGMSGETWKAKWKAS